MSTDRFRIGLRLRHPSLDPSDISKAFDLTPTYSWKAGSLTGKVVHKWSVWSALILEGARSEEYEQALLKSILLIETQQEWLTATFGNEGELDLIFSYWTGEEEGLLCQTNFYPELLARLSKLKAGIQIEVWKEDSETEEPIDQLH